MNVKVTLTVSSTFCGLAAYHHLRNCKAAAKAPVPDELSLQLVQIVFRHGARTPLVQPRYLPYINYTNFVEHAPHTFVPYNTKRPNGDPFIKEMKQDGKGARNGQLTAKGAQQMYDLGTYLRQRYISQLGFIDSSYNGQVAVRSTEITRAIESARCTLAGLFPDASSAIPIIIASVENEDLYPNFRRCMYLTRLTRWAWTDPDMVPELESARKRIQSTLKIPHEEKVHIVELRDNMACHKFHGLLPPEYDLPVVQNDLEEAATKLMDHVFAGHGEAKPKALQLGIGPLLGLVLDNMQRAIDGRRETKMHLFSGHDTTLMPLLHALDIHDSRWPPYAASITFELYKDERNSEHYVRVLYLNEEQTLPACGKALCPLPQFKQAMSKFLIEKDHYKEQCAVEDDRLLRSIPKP